ncbi:MAG: response regulator [Lachnospiraceae bacterium]|nr:response regulator [Lachnospiraceae bacterium]
MLGMLGTDNGTVLVISDTDSFLAKSLVTKLKSKGIDSVFVHDEIKEIEPYKSHTTLMVLFMNDGMEIKTRTLVYLKDIAEDNDSKFILVGDESGYENIKKTIPEPHILDMFKRPLIMDDLIERIERYREDNSGENRKKSILIVDDDITYMRTVFEWLKDEYHVGMAASGVQAISYLTKNKADLVLLDYEMPVANGPQVLQMLKSDSQTDSVPVMFLTGHGERESVMSVLDLKPVDYLLKSIGKEALLKKLGEFFEQTGKSDFRS